MLVYKSIRFGYVLLGSIFAFRCLKDYFSSHFKFVPLINFLRQFKFEVILGLIVILMKALDSQFNLKSFQSCDPNNISFCPRAKYFIFQVTMDLWP